MNERLLELLGEAAAAAVCTPRLRGRTSDVVAARCAAAQVCNAKSTLLAPHLGVGARAVQKLRRHPIERRLARAVWLQWRLRIELDDPAIDQTTLANERG
jgi:hypothetical protein